MQDPRFTDPIEPPLSPPPPVDPAEKEEELTDATIQSPTEPIKPAECTDTNEPGVSSEEPSVSEETAAEISGSAPKKSTPFYAVIFEYAELFVICLCVVMLAFSFVFRICTVSGPSMLPTLQDGENLLVTDLFYDPAPGDIVVFHQTSDTVERFNEPIVKRIIAVGGQTVRIDFTNATIAVDGVELTEDYIQLVDTLGREIGEYKLFADHHFRFEQQADGKSHRIFEATVPQGTLFVMGDNRNNSADSRDDDIGFVDERRVLGKVVCRLKPLERFGPVT